MINWSDSKNRPKLPGHRGPGPLIKLFWALEDWWRFLDPMHKATVALVVLGMALWILITRA